MPEFVVSLRMEITAPMRKHLFLLVGLVVAVGGAATLGRRTETASAVAPAEANVPDHSRSEQSFLSGHPTSRRWSLEPIPSPPLPEGLAAAIESGKPRHLPVTELTLVEASPRDFQTEFADVRTRVTPSDQGHATRLPVHTSPATPTQQPHCRTYRIVEGDTLEQIAHYYYGDPAMAGLIFRANTDRLHQPDILPLGVKLVLPDSQNSAPTRDVVESARTELVPVEGTSSPGQSAP